MFKTCKKCGKTYSTDRCSCEGLQTKEVNYTACVNCGRPASVFPFFHNPKGQYTLPELNSPANSYCESCFYALIKKDHKAKYIADKQKKEQA